MLLAILFVSAMHTDTAQSSNENNRCAFGQVVNASGGCVEEKKSCPDGSVVKLTVSCPSSIPSSYLSTVRGPNMAPVPRGNIGSWITSDDYPSAALLSEKSGRTNVKLTVNKWGSVADCEVIISSGDSLLDEATCRGIAYRARFYPATDNNSKPILGYYSKSVSWVVPKETPDIKVEQGSYLYDQAPPPRKKRPQTFLESGFFNVEMIVKADGTLGECTETGDLFKKMAEKATMCSEARMGLEVYEPYLDASGMPVKKKLKIRMTVEISDTE